MDNVQFINDLIKRNLTWMHKYHEGDKNHSCEAINNDARIVCDFTSFFGFNKKVKIQIYDKIVRKCEIFYITDKSLYQSLLSHVKQSESEYNKKVENIVKMRILSNKTD